MGLADALLPEFDHEAAITRKTLARVPEDKLQWKPHEKSMSLVGLATHLANLPRWTVFTMEGPSYDVAPPGGEPFRLEPVASVEEAIRLFDKSVAEARASLSSATDQALLAPWSLLSGGKTVLTMPRIAVLRSFVMNHMIHHRAQLGVYLRLNDVPVPATYGSSADEAP